MKKIITLITAVLFISTALLVSCASNEKKSKSKNDKKVESVNEEPTLKFDPSAAVKDNGSKPFKGTTAILAVKDMTVGWNLGNTFDAPSETGWGQPKTTKAMIDGLAASGIKTLRLPVSWTRHFNTQTYQIDKAWMNRVKEVVDWAIDDGMYVIINSHHDNFSMPTKMPAGKGYYPNSVNYNESAQYLMNIWSQICLAFNNGYDEHLIFETMNEPRPRGTNNEWWFNPNDESCKEYMYTLCKLNQVVVDTVRASGGNNQKRFIMCPSLAASADAALNPQFKMPVDDENGKLICSVHMYSPYNFAMASPGDRIFTAAHTAELGRTFSQLNNKFVKNGYAVVIGEMGATNKDNLEERVKWTETFISLSRKYGMTSCLWDNGVWDLKGGTDYSEKYGFYNRREQTWFFPEITEAMVETANGENNEANAK